MSYFKDNYRTSCCMAEKREALAIEEAANECGLHLKVRAKRNVRNLPNAWDDIPKPKMQKSWKKLRKAAQFQPVEVEGDKILVIRPQYIPYGYCPENMPTMFLREYQCV